MGQGTGVGRAQGTPGAQPSACMPASRPQPQGLAISGGWGLRVRKGGGACRWHLFRSCLSGALNMSLVCLLLPERGPSPISGAVTGAQERKNKHGSLFPHTSISLIIAIDLVTLNVGRQPCRAGLPRGPQPTPWRTAGLSPLRKQWATCSNLS